MRKEKEICFSRETEQQLFLKKVQLRGKAKPNTTLTLAGRKIRKYFGQLKEKENFENNRCNSQMSA